MAGYLLHIKKQIAVTGTMSFGAVLDGMISSGMSAEGLASKLISLAAEAAGPIAVVLGGTAILWRLLPMEAGESEEQATAWMEKDKTAGDIISERKQESIRNFQRNGEMLLLMKLKRRQKEEIDQQGKLKDLKKK